MEKWAWTLCFCVLVISQCNTCLGCLKREREALLELKSSLFKSLYYDHLYDWDDDKGIDCCAWKRVKCNTTTHRVTKLSLDGMVGGNSEPLFLNMSYFLPFKELQHLDLSFNSIGGWQKTEGLDKLSKLKKLEILNLEGNELNSTTLSSLGVLKSLKSLNFGSNLLAAASQSELSKGLEGLSKLKSLVFLSLSQNYLNNSVIPFLGELTSIKTLTLRGNALEGSLSQFYGVFTNLRNLEVLDLSFNHLHDFFHFHDLGKMSKLKTLDLSFNNFSGSIPPSLLSLSSLQSLSLSNTHITDSLSGICVWKNLQDLDLSLNKFEGSIPPCLGNLTSLRMLDVSYTQLTGSIPPSLIYGLTRLELLDLSKNQLSGKIPLSSITNLTSLQFISFSDNQFEGADLLNSYVDHMFQLKFLGLSHCNLNTSTVQLLHFLHNQYSLGVVDLSYNNLHGTFPNWLIVNNTRLEILVLRNNLVNGHIRFPHNVRGSLSVFDVSTNDIQGQLQPNMGHFIPRVQSLNLSQNSLDGKIPSSLGNMKELQTLDLSSNNFSGEIPESLALSCKKLQALVLSSNRLDGRISPALFNLTLLEHLRLDNNQLTGNLPNVNLDLANVNSDQFMIPLDTLDISQNRILGRVPSWIANLSKLTSLSMRHNSLRGPIPLEICNSINLNFLDLSHNRLSGSLPSCLSLAPLRYIHLHNNSLTGTIPKELFKTSDLLTLDLMHNSLSGNIPSHVGASINLRILLLKGNRLSGSVPHEMCKMNKIGLLDLSHNNLSGSIPPCFGNITFGKTGAVEPVYQDPMWFDSGGRYTLYKNHLKTKSFDQISYSQSTDQEEVGFTTKNRDDSYKGHILNLMSGMDLSCNQFTGVIPLEIGALTGVHALNFSHNQLTGKIPKTLSNLKQLESLDLSHNKFSGEIPSDLIGLFNLAVFTVAYNNLSGRVPDMKAQFSTFQETSYEGNPLLCGPPLKKQCKSKIKDPAVIAPLSRLGEKYEIDIVSLLASFAATCAMSLLGLVIVLYINPYWRRLWFDFVDACLSFMFPFCSEAIYRTSNPFT